MADDDRWFDRRRFLRALGASAATASLAGCSVHASDSGIDVNLGGGGGDETTQTTQMPMTSTTPDSETTRAGTATTTGGTTTATTTSTTTTSKPRSGGTLQLATESTTTLDPVRVWTSEDTAVVEKVFDGLTSYVDGGVEVENQLATDISASDGGRTYTVTLRDDATFHDGSSVTASDVVYSWERLTASPNSHYPYLLTSMLGVEHEMQDDPNNPGEEVYKPGSMAVRAVGSDRVEFDLEEPMYATPKLLAHPAFAPVPEGIVGDVQGYSGRMSHDEFQKNPVGSGPFTVDRYVEDSELVLGRNADYHGQKPDLDGIHWQFIDDQDTRYQYGLDGNADFQSIPFEKYDSSKIRVDSSDDRGRRFGTYGPLSNGATLSYESAPILETYYFSLNTDRVEKPVRRAMAYTLNQQMIVDQTMNGRAYPAYHYTPPGLYPDHEYDQHAKQQYPYGYDDTRIGDARTVMESAGYGPNNRYEVTISVFRIKPSILNAAQILRDQLASAHVNVTVEKLPLETLIERKRKGELDVYSLFWGADYPGADDFLANIYPPYTDTAQEGGALGVGVDWAGTDAAKRATLAWQSVRSNMREGDSEARARASAYVSMEEANWEDVVLLPLYHSIDERFAYDGVDVPAFGDLGRGYQEFADVVKR